MALIEKFHVIAAERTVATGQTIREGMIVSLNSNGEVVVQGAANPIPYGIAGDSKLTSSSAMPGISAGWQNRVSDYFDETKASGKITVYHGGGEFLTDQFTADVTALTPLAYNALYAVDGILDPANSQSSGIVARLLKLAGQVGSGVPGVDVNGDQALSSGLVGTVPTAATNTYIEIKLVI